MTRSVTAWLEEDDAPEEGVPDLRVPLLLPLRLLLPLLTRPADDAVEDCEVAEGESYLRDGMVLKQ